MPSAPHRTTRQTAGLLPVLLLALAPTFPLSAQDIPIAPAFLSLDEAIELARRHNPGYLAVRNDLNTAEWGVRAAYGRFLPSANVSAGLGWQGSGAQRIGTLTLQDLGVGEQPNYYSSNYSVGLGYSLSGATFSGLSEARAVREQTAAGIEQARLDLDTRITVAYLEVWRQKDAVELARQQLERVRFNLRLAQGQVEVGAATGLTVSQAEVQVGRAEVALLQADNAAATATYRLLQAIGLRPSPAIGLTTDFEVSAPEWTESELLDMAVRGSPALQSRRLSRRAAESGVRSARSAYFPSLSLNVGWSGFTRQASNTDLLVAQAQGSSMASYANCQGTNELYSRLADPLPPVDCSMLLFTDADRQRIVASNDVFPFDFTRSPPNASLTVSLPIFQGFAREQQLQAARARLDDTEHQLRDQEIALQADVAIGLARLQTAHRSVELEERNQAYANEQLRLAQEQYRVGLVAFLDLVEAETVKAQADRDLLNAVYTYHDALTNLEAVVGQPLRNR